MNEDQATTAPGATPPLPGQAGQPVAAPAQPVTAEPLVPAAPASPPEAMAGAAAAGDPDPRGFGLDGLFDGSADLLSTENLTLYFAIVMGLGLFYLVVLLLKRLVPNWLMLTGGARIGVREIRTLDYRRKLVLIRRDDIEHLVILRDNGADTIVETGIRRDRKPLALFGGKRPLVLADEPGAAEARREARAERRSRRRGAEAEPVVQVSLQGSGYATSAGSFGDRFHAGADAAAGYRELPLSAPAARGGYGAQMPGLAAAGPPGTAAGLGQGQGFVVDPAADDPEPPLRRALRLRRAQGAEAAGASAAPARRSSLVGPTAGFGDQADGTEDEGEGAGSRSAGSGAGGLHDLPDPAIQLRHHPRIGGQG